MVKLGAVQCLPNVDTVMIPPCHRIPRDTEADLEEAQCLGFWDIQDAHGGYTAHLCAVPHQNLQGGVIVSPG